MMVISKIKYLIVIVLSFVLIISGVLLFIFSSSDENNLYPKLLEQDDPYILELVQKYDAGYLGYNIGFVYEKAIEFQNLLTSEINDNYMRFTAIINVDNYQIGVSLENYLKSLETLYGSEFQLVPEHVFFEDILFFTYNMEEKLYTPVEIESYGDLPYIHYEVSDLKQNNDLLEIEVKATYRYFSDKEFGYISKISDRDSVEDVLDEELKLENYNMYDEFIHVYKYDEERENYYLMEIKYKG